MSGGVAAEDPATGWPPISDREAGWMTRFEGEELETSVEKNRIYGSKDGFSFHYIIIVFVSCTCFPIFFQKFGTFTQF